MSSNPLLDMLQSQLTNDQLIKQLSHQLGGADKEKTKAAAGGIVTALTGALAKNAQSKQGAASLASALDRDHDGSILDDVISIMSGQKTVDNQRMLNGSGILRHVLGDRQQNAANMISQVSGLEKDKVGSLMTMLAPILMGALGKTKRQQGLDIGDLQNLLSGTVEKQRQESSSANSLLTHFLDSDGDGDIKDDVGRIGINIFKSLFRRKK